MTIHGRSAENRCAAAWPAVSRCMFLCAVILTLPPGLAFAQSVNYGVLSEIFAQPVTTSATGQPQLASEVPASLTILSAEDIRRFGARSLPDVLAQVMSIDVTTWAVGSQDVGLRGLNLVQNPRVLVLVNGRQVYLEHVGTPKWSGIPVQLSEIRQIEIVRGPQTALFGFNAVSGVINIITYNPLLDKRNAAEVTVGTGANRDVSAVATVHPTDSLGIRLSAGGWSRGEFSGRGLDKTTIRGQGGVERAVFSVDALAQLASDLQLGTELTFSDWRNTEVEAGQQAQFGIYETSSARIYAKADTDLLGLVDANIYINRLDFELRNTGIANAISSVSTLTVAQLQALKRLAPDLSIRIGGEYRLSSLDVPGVQGAEVSYSVWSMSGMADWTPVPDLSAVLAIRQDVVSLHRQGQEVPPFSNADYKRDLHPFSYNASLVWRATPTDTLRATVGSGSQSLSQSELGLAANVSAVFPDGTTQSIFLSGNPRLDPGRMTQAELGWTRRLDAIDGTLVANVYLQDLKNLTMLFDNSEVSINGFNTLTYGNLGDQFVWGFEGAVNGRSGPFRAGLSYTWADGQLDLSPRVPGVVSARESVRIDLGDLTRTHLVKGTLGWAQGDWAADLLVIWQSGLEAAGSRPVIVDGTGDSIATQAAVSWTPLPGWRFSLAASNFLESSTQLSLAPPVDRRIWLTVHVDF
jgi:outer membrane receptor for ferrienterochelin and colicins